MKKWFGILLAVVFCAALLCVSVSAANNVPYIDYEYNTTTGILTERSGAAASATEVTNGMTWWNDGWYVVNGDVTINERIAVSGTVNLILADGCTLTAPKGIEVNAEQNLNIYAQSGGDNMGGLTISGPDRLYAGIGANMGVDAGTIRIYGGTIDVTGGDMAAGIGGTNPGSAGTVEIYGGDITARGRGGSAGIGAGLKGGYRGNSVTIYGGVVRAAGASNDADAIGSASELPGEEHTDAHPVDVTIYGGTVIASQNDSTYYSIAKAGNFSTGESGKALILCKSIAGEAVMKDNYYGMIGFYTGQNQGTLYVRGTGQTLPQDLTITGGTIYTGSSLRVHGVTLTVNDGVLNNSKGTILRQHRTKEKCDIIKPWISR